jgi:hypothetical protein
MANNVTQGTGIGEQLFVADDLERAPLVVTTAAVTVYEIYLQYGASTSDGAFKAYDVAGGTAITVGTTYPDVMLFWDGSVWGSAAERRFVFPAGLKFDNGLVIAASGQAGRAASGDPSSTLVVKILYK